MKFSVKRYWEVCDEVEVEAQSRTRAIEAAHTLQLDHSKSKYVPESLNSDPDTDVQQLIGGDK